LYGLGRGENLIWFSLLTLTSWISFSKISWLFEEYPQNSHEFVYPFRRVTFLKYFFTKARLPLRLLLCFRRTHLQIIPNIIHPSRFFVSVHPPLELK
jgi:hypothetical protein